ncbi:hypothetical protein [Dyadobacter sp. CY312]|uniref:hypothetical protein n=1 Tax=Dyadobacter sp. CY312 TaxID=2907303 RepID=UPI001F2026F2|nr:hypothetical protein [Dyadobacter sp. CY312]MCE7041073.1 hypothetical protein [Dyadobacter sp. CY312]
MKLFIRIAALFFLVVETSFGQIDPEESRKHVILKWSPLSMFDVDNTVQLGVEVPLPDSRFTIQQDVGYGHANFNIWYAEQGPRPNKYTIKTRTQFRFYFHERPRFRAYVAGEYLYKKVVNSDVRWIGRDCSETGGCSFFENMKVRQGRFVNALHVKAGWQFYISNRTTVDLFVGMGGRRASVRMLTPNVENVNLDSDWNFWRSDINDRPEVIPSLAVGFHLGLALGRFKSATSSQ